MPRTVLLRGLILACGGLLITGCEDANRPVAPTDPAPTAPSFTAGSGVGAIDFGPDGTIARATFDAFRLRRLATAGDNNGWPHGRWQLDIEAKPSLDLAVRSFVYAPGSYTGWHSHPGPVFIQVLRGTVTFYDSDDPDCTPIVVRQGETFLDTGEHAHIGRNETDEEAQDLVVILAPEGAAFRNDEPDPGHCSFPS